MTWRFVDSSVDDGQPNQCGAYRTVSYTLLDQQGQAIITDMPITELISNYSGPPNVQPLNKTVNLNNGALNDLFAFFTSAPTCPSPFSATFTQNFNVSVGLNVYNLTTTNALTLARNASGTNTINVVITTP